MKELILLIAFFIVVNGGSTSLGWTDARDYEGKPVPNQSMGKKVAVDSLGNYWTCGTQDSGVLKFGTTSLTSSYRDLVLFKNSPTHSSLFAISLTLQGMSDEGEALAVAIDSQNNVIVGGWFRGTLNIGSNVHSSSSFYAMFVAKFSSTGTLLWSKSTTNTGNSVLNSIEIDSSNNILVFGTYKGSFTLDSISVPSTSDNDGFILKLTSAGVAQQQLVSSGTGTHFTTILDSHIDSQNNVYITGSFNNNVKFGSTTLSAAGTNFFVAKISSTLTWTGAATSTFVSGTPLAEAYAITFDGTYVYITGRIYGGSVSFGSRVLISGPEDSFVAVLTSSLSFTCAVQTFTLGGRGNAITTSASGLVWAGGALIGSGNFSGNIVSSSSVSSYVIYLTKVSSSCVFSGTVSSTVSSGGARLASISSRANNVVILTGYAAGTNSFGSKTISSGSNALFTAAYSF